MGIETSPQLLSPSHIMSEGCFLYTVSINKHLLRYNILKLGNRGMIEVNSAKPESVIRLLLSDIILTEFPFFVSISFKNSSNI
jgi:hypothetical protein